MGKMETVTDCIFLGSKITVDGDCNHDIKRCLLLGRKADKPRPSIKKQRLHFADKGLCSQSYGSSSSHVLLWTMKKTECWRINSFELCWWRTLFRVVWTARADSLGKSLMPWKTEQQTPDQIISFTKYLLLFGRLSFSFVDHFLLCAES